jgi:hypothetical protein
MTARAQGAIYVIALPTRPQSEYNFVVKNR